MLKRFLINKINQNIKTNPAVALLGARQIGKTTLAKTISQNINSIYLDLESPEDLLKLRDPNSFFDLHKDKLIILDEIQRVPDLFMVMRGIIDKNRQSGRKGGQFLLLGSASMDLMRQSSESLAGRINYIEMSGLNVLELPKNNNNEIKKLWFKGGFPESYLAENDALSMEWLEMLIRTYVERDIPQMGFRIPATRLRRLWTMLAHLQGENVNFSKLAGNLEITSKTVSSYTDILTDMLLVRRLEPWHENTKKRLVKSPRFYIRDSGILHRLLSIANYEELLSNPVLGKSWEGFVIENLMSVIPNSVKTYYYRTSSGNEIDLLIKISSKELWAVEIKYGTAPKIKLGFHSACQDINSTHKFIVYGGDDEFPIEDNTTVISLFKIVEKLKKATEVV